jgi:aspartate kinase
MASNPGVAATMFETLADNNVNIEMIATSPIRISCVIAEQDVDRATAALHTAYGLD